MTGIVHTIHMCIGRLAALMTMSNDLVGNSLSQTLIKNKILSMKFYIEPFFFGLVHIIDNAALEMKYILKSFVQHISRSFLATDTAGTIHNDILVFIFLHHIGGHR